MTSRPIDAYIGLGSNLDDPIAQVTEAISQLSSLRETRLVAHSPWYSSKAIGPGQQPDYVNGVALLQTHLDAQTLLKELLAIEQQHHRVRVIKWGPRTLDLDLLLYGQEIINSATLTVPHPRLKQRSFVLYPLADINPQLVMPCGESIDTLLARTSSSDLIKLTTQQGTNSDSRI